MIAPLFILPFTAAEISALLSVGISSLILYNSDTDLLDWIDQKYIPRSTPKDKTKEEVDNKSFAITGSKVLSAAKVEAITTTAEEEGKDETPKYYYLRAKKLSSKQNQMLLFIKKNKEEVKVYSYPNLTYKKQILAIELLEQAQENAMKKIENQNRLGLSNLFYESVKKEDFTKQLEVNEITDILKEIKDEYGYNIASIRMDDIVRDFKKISMHHIMSEKNLEKMADFIGILRKLDTDGILAMIEEKAKQKLYKSIINLGDICKNIYIHYWLNQGDSLSNITDSKEQVINNAKKTINDKETYKEFIANKMPGPSVDNRLIEEYYYKSGKHFDRAIDSSMPDEHKQAGFLELFKSVKEMYDELSVMDTKDQIQHFVDKLNKSGSGYKYRLTRIKAFFIKFISLWNNKSRIVYGPLQYNPKWQNSKPTERTLDTKYLKKGERETALNHVQVKTLGRSAG